jgi:uncharacterized protein (TIGR00162 family)
LVEEIYSSSFPPYVLIKKDGLVEPLKNEVYEFEDSHDERILFFTGNAQASSPEGQYRIAKNLLDKLKSVGLTKIYSIAAFLSDRSFTKPRVYGTTTTPSLMDEIKKNGVVAMDQGLISGINGLILGLATKMKLQGICLLGETHGYQTTTGQYLLDAKAVRAVLEVLTKMLNISIDMEPIDKQTEQMDEMIARMTKIEKKFMEETYSTTDKSKRYIT